MKGVDFAAFKESQYDILAGRTEETSGYEKNLRNTGRRNRTGKGDDLMKVELEKCKADGHREKKL